MERNYGLFEQPGDEFGHQSKYTIDGGIEFNYFFAIAGIKLVVVDEVLAAGRIARN